MNSNINVDKQNVKSYVKSFTSQLVKNRGNLQFLLACLPDDMSKWRAGTNRRDMQKANMVARVAPERQVWVRNFNETIIRVRRYSYGKRRFVRKRKRHACLQWTKPCGG